MEFSGGTTELMITPLNLARIEARQRKKIARQDAVFVHGLVARRGQPPVRDQLRAAKNAQHRVGVSDVERQQHQFASETSPDMITSSRAIVAPHAQQAVGFEAIGGAGVSFRSPWRCARVCRARSSKLR